MDNAEIKIKNNLIYFPNSVKIDCNGFKGKGWYFWDETETNLIGPFENDKKAIVALNVYSLSI